MERKEYVNANKMQVVQFKWVLNKAKRHHPAAYNYRSIGPYLNDSILIINRCLSILPRKRKTN